MSRPPKYPSATARPVSVSLRIPRDLYEDTQHYAQRHHTTLTELLLGGLRLRLETPSDPRDIRVSQGITAIQAATVLQDATVIQELHQLIDARVLAILEAQRERAEDTSKTPRYRNAAPVPQPAPPPVHDSNAEIQPDSNTVTPQPARARSEKAVVIDRLRLMRQEGLSFGKIAQRLNAEGLPTLTGRGQWNPGTLKKLLSPPPV